MARHLRRIGERFELKTPDALIFGEKGYVVESISYAQKLVAEGISVETSLFDTYEESVEYAKSRGIKRMIRVADEIFEIDL